MYFYLSRFTYFVLNNQLLLIFLILLTSLILYSIKKKSFSKKLLYFAIIYFLIIAVLPTGKILLFFLEKNISHQNYSFDYLDGILILSGNEDVNKSVHYDQLYTGGSTFRLIEGIKLKKKFPSAKLVFSGGSGNLFSSHLSTDVAEKFIQIYLDNDNKNVIFERNSSNTYENILFTREIIKPNRKEKWALVTSAFHVIRAQGVANKLGWSLIPYPVDFRTSSNLLGHFFNLDLIENISYYQVGTREIFGLLVYKLLNRI
tara:strand:- start:19 stop:795 length:777 start_codon:yes stop_codon:yes gene_type:complete